MNSLYVNLIIWMDVRKKMVNKRKSDIKKNDSINIKFRNSQNHSMLLRMFRITVIPGDERTGKRTGGAFWQPVMFCFLIQVLVTWVCALCEIHKLYTQDSHTLLHTYYTLIKSLH